ncbi:MAG: aspartate aminotransferase family protein, partial [Deltaproteobacteria bacterium]|nr:aspartate aminotransferase family protein [Deltaproteobacteria bacterium]
QNQVETVSYVFRLHFTTPQLEETCRKICDKYDVLLMMDEVMTGIGRTGKLFGYEHFDTIPDIMTLGKGLSGGYFQLGAVVARARVTDVIEQNSGLFPSGCTWAGNPMAAVVAGKTIDMVKGKNLVHRANQMGQYLGSKLEWLRTHPSVGDVRNR